MLLVDVLEPLVSDRELNIVEGKFGSSRMLCYLVGGVRLSSCGVFIGSGDAVVGRVFERVCGLNSYGMEVGDVGVGSIP